MRFDLDPQDIESIAQRVIELLKPHLPPREEPEEILLTTEEAARKLKTSSGQIYQWVNKTKHGLGSFPYFKTGKQLRFSKRELFEWLKSNKNG